MGDIVFKIAFPFSHKTVLTIETLQMCLGSQIDADPGPQLFALHQRLLHQSMTETVASGLRRCHHPADHHLTRLGDTRCHQSGVGHQHAILLAESVEQTGMIGLKGNIEAVMANR